MVINGETVTLAGQTLTLISRRTLVVGSGCAGYNAADWLWALGERDAALVTEGVLMGTSRNTGSDKQTYYKLTLAGDGADSAADMARTLFEGGGMHGDTALCEAAGSVRGFMKLVNLGVPFPTDAYGGFAGYKTDHDPRQRATSAGPLTSRYMTECLQKAVEDKGIPVYDGMQALRVLTHEGRVCGLLCLDTAGLTRSHRGLTVFRCENIILATGGPAGVYATSVYPESQTGAAGLIAEAGAELANMAEWQYGLASTEFRWNVSGTYQQVLPRYVSVDEEGREYEFLTQALGAAQALNDTFLKGYQWPFDVRKREGSSRVDMLVYAERAKGRRVYMDFRKNPAGLENGFDLLGLEARKYLENSGACQPTPFARLAHMNPQAIELYRSHGIDLQTQMLAVDVCAQHHNGGAAVDANWQTNIRGLYAAGEAAGTFGVYRPGGSALNSAQVGSLRAAEHIVYGQKKADAPSDAAFYAALTAAAPFAGQVLAAAAGTGPSNVVSRRAARAARMSACAAHMRDVGEMARAQEDFARELDEFWQAERLSSPQELPHLLKNRDILLSQLAVLSAALACADVYGSRGAALVSRGDILPTKDDAPNCQSLTRLENSYTTRFIPVRPLPEPDAWFENVWRDYVRRRTGQN